MSEDTTVSFSLEINISPETFTTLRQAEAILFRTAGLLRRMGLSENLDSAISKMQRAIAVANQLRLVLAALQAARAASGDPLAMAQLGIGIGAFVYTADDFFNEVFSG